MKGKSQLAEKAAEILGADRVHIIGVDDVAGIQGEKPDYIVFDEFEDFIRRKIRSSITLKNTDSDAPKS